MRFVTFLKASGNNLPETVFQLFQESCNKYGIPNKVRSDRGGENVLVRDFMQKEKGPEGFITGSSVHNQRIGRLWRDVYERVVSNYHDLFQDMEERGLIDMNNETDFDILRHGMYDFFILVFLPAINYSLFTFREMHNAHHISKVGVPSKLFKPTYFEERVNYDLDMIRLVREFYTMKIKYS